MKKFSKTLQNTSMINKTISEKLSSLLELNDIAKKYPKAGPLNKSVENVLLALADFMECVRYLNTRRTTETILSLNSEDAIQDAIYLMLRPWIPDITPENPTDKIANRYVIKDFLIPSIKTVIEVKYIRDRKHGKDIAKEINDDIETYRYHPNCTSIIFFIYDPEAVIPDQLKLKQHISCNRIYSEKTLQCYPIIKP